MVVIPPRRDQSETDPFTFVSLYHQEDKCTELSSQGFFFSYVMFGIGLDMRIDPCFLMNNQN